MNLSEALWYLWEWWMLLFCTLIIRMWIRIHYERIEEDKADAKALAEWSAIMRASY